MKKALPVLLIIAIAVVMIFQMDRSANADFEVIAVFGEEGTGPGDEHMEKPEGIAVAEAGNHRVERITPQLRAGSFKGYHSIAGKIARSILVALSRSNKIAMRPSGKTAMSL
jgi:hypothetical protein